MKRFLLFTVLSTSALFSQAVSNSDAELLLHPKALAAKPAQETPEQFRKNFADPPAEYRSMPLWVWNDMMDPQRMTEQLRQFKQQGMGGVFIHPRPGLMTEYLSPEWFRLWKTAMTEGKRLGLLVNIYDENSYPSGFSGGHVPAQAPDTASQYVQIEESRTVQNRGITVAFFSVTKDNTGRVLTAKRVQKAADVPAGQTVLAFRMRRASGNPWTGEFPYVDLTNPRTTPTFLETTYERYKENVGTEFGKTVRWSFTDEPLIATAGAYDSAALALPLSYNTLAEFQKRNGYDLADEIVSLFWDVGDYRRVRFDYWQTLHDLWKENWARPMFQWCDRNGLQFTGHYMEHEWPAPWITPADASLYAYEHAPGIDMLEGTGIRTQGKDPHMLFTIRQMASVSHQLGRRAFCEAYGVAGWDSTFEHYKRFGDWLMVNGVNFMNQHLAFSTIRGARKRDHPQSFTDVSPWWPQYQLHADHLARVSYLSSRSEPRNRVLLLTPTTSGFLLARRGSGTPELNRMRADNAELNQFLADHQVDYDLADEYMIEWVGKEEGRRFTIGKASYDLVIWPPNMTNVRRQSVPHLERYLSNGGTVLALTEPAAYVDGRPNDAVAKLAARYRSQWVMVQDHAALLAAIQQRLGQRIRFDQEMPAGVGFSDRYLANGDRVLFLTNTGLAKVRSGAEVAGGSLQMLDTATGEIKPATYTTAGGKLRFDVELEPAGSVLLLVKTGAGTPPSSQTAAANWEPVKTAWRAKADALNVLVLDYCDLKSGGDVYKDINTWQANWTIWQRHGFERPAWDNAVQYRTSVFDRNHFDERSGFEATYRFELGSVVKGLELAVESPELYRITVNGSAAPFDAGKRWLDPHMRSVNIDALVRAGQNEIVIAARPFDVKMELENIYIRGPFAVESGSKGFRISGPARALDAGSWAKQGYPFYGDAVTYETEVTVPAGGAKLQVELADWQGSVFTVAVDGKQLSAVGWRPYRAEFAAQAGKHTIAVKVVSTPRNTFGPFHNPTKPRMRAWPAAWADFPEHQPAGGAYDILDYGLMSLPVVRAAAR
jgi:hypothetical protein